MDSVCVFVAHNHLVLPEEVEVDLRFETKTGEFHSYASYGFFGKEHLNHQGLIDAVAFYLASWHNFIPERLHVDLAFVQGEGIIADITVI
jgi:hypothetical protein